MKPKKKQSPSKRAVSISLKQLEVTKGWFSVNGLFDAIKPFATEYLIDNPFINRIEVYDLCSSWINAELESLDLRGNEKATGNLADIIGTKKTANFEKTLLKYLNSIPHEYWFFFYCPQLSHKKLGFRHLNSNFSSIECFSRNYQATLKSLLDSKYLQNRHVVQENISNGFHFRILASGFATKEYLNSASVLATRRFKHLFIGLLVEKKIEIGFASSPFTVNEGQLFIVDKINPSDVQKIEIPENLRKFLGRVKIPKKEEVSPSPLGELLNIHIDRTDYFLEKVSGGLKILLDSDENSDDIECIRTASEWLFDAKLNEDDPSLKVMQLAAAAEAVLAEGKKIENNITKTLSDRCAYLLGYNAKQRGNIRASFSKFYEIRSSLVHGRSRVLLQKDQHIVDWAESIVESIIRKETTFLTHRKK
ncbi:MAG: hypothetical protein WA160_05705 [Pseudobdellovibrio sp.]